MPITAWRGDTLRRMKRPVRLSASSLAVLLACPRCFWLQVHEELRRPQGPFPSLPGGMDAIIKTAFDAYRKRGELPPELRGQVRGTLFADQQQLNRWRDPLRGDLRFSDRDRDIEVVGGIDELVEEPDGRFTPVDFKTRGWVIKDDSHRHYEHQLDLYAWLFERLGKKTSGQGVLLFFSPVTYEGEGRVQFRIEPVAMKTDPKRADTLLARAATILGQDEPTQHADCVFCHYVVSRTHDVPT